MDVGTVRGLITLALMLAFIALVVRVYSRDRKSEFDAVARLPLEDGPATDRQRDEIRDDNR